MHPGQRFGAYRVDALLGAGGMGEVYRAHDSRLGRDVALKVLPPDLIVDADRLARFEREARILASLNHPNIAQIYGVEETDGVRALVLELVDGETLAERIARGPVPLKEALAIARQVTDALDAAHEKGVIHRDLKPANIKVTPGGTVKVLDFGLAKAAEPADIGVGASAATVRVGSSHEGLIIGTAAYMSPEQARGQAIDKRTDIWAFGCVLFELLTGRSTFGRSTITDTLAAVIEREPDWAALPAAVPATLRWVLQRCLEKDARRRTRDAGDILLDLEAAPAPEARTDRRGWAWAAVLIATTLVAAAAGLSVLAPTSPGEAGMVLDRLTYDSGLTTMASLAPGGRLLAYASNRAGRPDLDIWVQQVGGGAPLRITDDPSEDATPDFSPDGSQIIFRSEREGGGVFAAPALGGAARLIVREGRDPRFSPDGTRIAYWTGQWRGAPSDLESAAFVLSLDGGPPVRIAPQFRMARAPIWSPDGRSLLILGRRDNGPLEQTLDWWWVPLPTGEPVKTGVLAVPEFQDAEPAPAAWTQAGAAFVVLNRLWRVGISQTNGQVTSPPVRLFTATGDIERPAVGPDGTIVFTDLNVRRVIARAPVAPGHEHEPYTTLYTDERRQSERASVTTDGSRIVFEQSFSRYREIWMRNTVTGEQQQIVRVDGTGQLNPTVSSEGTRLAYSVGPYARATGYVLEIGGGTPRQVCDQCQLYGFISDNYRILATWNQAHVIGLIDTRDGVRKVLVQDSEADIERPHASWDDRWLAFRGLSGVVAKSFVVPLTAGEPAPRAAWQEIVEPTTTGRPTGWALDRPVVYLLLDSDGYRCLWAQQLNATTGRLEGTPTIVRHFHDQRQLSLGVSTSLGNPITPQGFVFEGGEMTGNLWRLTTSP